VDVGSRTGWALWQGRKDIGLTPLSCRRGAMRNAYCALPLVRGAIGRVSKHRHEEDAAAALEVVKQGTAVTT